MAHQTETAGGVLARNQFCLSWLIASSRITPICSVLNYNIVLMECNRLFN